MAINIQSMVDADTAAIIGSGGEVAEEIAYNAATIWAIVVRNKEIEKQVGLVISDATVYAKKSDIANPSGADKLVIDGINYRVGSIDDYSPSIWAIETNKWLGDA